MLPLFGAALPVEAVSIAKKAARTQVGTCNETKKAPALQVKAATLPFAVATLHKKAARTDLGAAALPQKGASLQVKAATMAIEVPWMARLAAAMQGKAERMGARLGRLAG